MGARSGHSDIRLTLGIYTHTELADQTATITALPSPPAIQVSSRNEPPASAEKVPTVVPRGAENGAVQLALKPYHPASDCTETAFTKSHGVATCATKTPETSNRPGGIRTPDQGIMSPLL